jgi:hypothetical protein
MLEDLATMLDRSYSDQAARTSLTDPWGDDVTTPNDMFVKLRKDCRYAPFQLNYEGGSTAISDYLAHLVSGIYHGLTGNRSRYRVRERTYSNQVISDFSYRVDGGVKILGEVKSPLLFDYFIGALIDKMRDGSPAKLCIESAPTTYHGYQSILAKVCVVASVVSCRIDVISTLARVSRV